MTTGMSQTSNKYTSLNNRVLFYDGDSIARNETIVDLMLSGINVGDVGIHFAEKTDDTDAFMKQYPNVMGYKTEIRDNDTTWDIPKQYKDLDVALYIHELLENEVEFMNTIKSEERIDRVHVELKLWEQYNMIPLLQTLIHIIDTFKENNIVWGTGRGSSCCCYILYLIGVHDVDSIHFGLELDEFFRD
jgi:DNA polymerase III alpha subunit